jgi:predicted Zn-ribbon and HTH transcriptional regulator
MTPKDPNFKPLEGTCPKCDATLDTPCDCEKEPNPPPTAAQDTRQLEAAMRKAIDLIDHENRRDTIEAREVLIRALSPAAATAAEPATCSGCGAKGDNPQGHKGWLCPKCYRETIPAAAEPRPAVERPAWAPADATHTSGSVVYRQHGHRNPWIVSGDTGAGWQDGHLSWQELLARPNVHPLASAAPAPPLAETLNEAARYQALVRLDGKKWEWVVLEFDAAGLGDRVAISEDRYDTKEEAEAELSRLRKAFSAPAEPPPAVARGERKTWFDELKEVRDGEWGALSLPVLAKLNELVMRVAAFSDQIEKSTQKFDNHVAALADAEKRGAEKWISVKDKLPECPGKYLVTTDGRVTTAGFTKRASRPWEFVGITHWQLLPPPPAQPVAGADAGGAK